MSTLSTVVYQGVEKALQRLLRRATKREWVAGHLTLTKTGEKAWKVDWDEDLFLEVTVRGERPFRDAVIYELSITEHIQGIEDEVELTVSPSEGWSAWVDKRTYQTIKGVMVNALNAIE